MKKILLSIVVLSLFMVSSSFALTNKESEVIDRALQRRIQKQPTASLITSIQAVLSRIDTIQMTARMTEKTAEIFSMIEQKLISIEENMQGITANTVTNTSMPSSQTIQNTTDTSVVLLAWTSSEAFWHIEFSTRYEAMIIKELRIQASTDTITEYVSELWLYDETWKLIGTTLVSWKEILFSALNTELQPGSHDRYIALRSTNPDQYTNSNSTNFTLQLQGILAQWSTSRREVSALYSNQLSPTITITPMAIERVSFLEQWNGIYTNTSLQAGWDTTLGIIAITASDSTSKRSDALILDQLSVWVQDNTTAKTVANNLFLERLDTADGKIYGNNNNSTVTFSLNEEIQEQQTAIFRIGSTITLDSNTREQVQVALKNLKTGWILYHPIGSNQQLATIKQYAREIFGTTISE